MAAADVKRLLGLTPHPCEGGWYVRTYQSQELLAPGSFADARYSGARHTGTAIYYLLEPGTFSKMHRLASDEIFHFYAGDTVEMLQLAPDGSGQVLRIGSRFDAGEYPQVVVPRGVWQGSRLTVGGQWALLGCTVSPGFEFDDYEAGGCEELVQHWPQHRDLIIALTRTQSTR